jgi:hypothetical protein
MGSSVQGRPNKGETVRENVRTLRPKLWEQKYWLLHHDNASSHISFFTREFFFTKSNIIVVLYPSYFSLFPRLKIEQKYRHFETVEVMETIASGAEHDFLDAFKNCKSAGKGACSQKGTTGMVVVAQS